MDEAVIKLSITHNKGLDTPYLEFHLENAIIYQSYRIHGLLRDKKFIHIAERYNATNAQLSILFASQLGVKVLTGTDKEERVKANITIDFELNPEEILEIIALLDNERLLYIYNKLQDGSLMSLWR